MSIPNNNGNWRLNGFQGDNLWSAIGYSEGQFTLPAGKKLKDFAFQIQTWDDGNAGYGPIAMLCPVFLKNNVNFTINDGQIVVNRGWFDLLNTPSENVTLFAKKEIYYPGTGNPLPLDHPDRLGYYISVNGQYYLIAHVFSDQTYFRISTASSVDLNNVSMFENPIYRAQDNSIATDGTVSGINYNGSLYKMIVETDPNCLAPPKVVWSGKRLISTLPSTQSPSFEGYYTFKLTNDAGKSVTYTQYGTDSAFILLGNAMGNLPMLSIMNSQGKVLDSLSTTTENGGFVSGEIVSTPPGAQ